MTPEVAIKQADRGALLPVYVIVGDEPFLRDEVTRALRSAAIGTSVAAFNEDKFTAGDVGVDTVIGAARTVPMMAPRRFVLVRNIERWDGGGEESADRPASAAFERLAEYASHPVPSTCLVLTATKLDGRRKFASLAKKEGFVVTCDMLSRQALPTWIAEQFKRRGHAIERDAAELLAEIAGPELSYVGDAVERLSLFAGPGCPITEHAVSECVARVRTADTWALVDAVGARDLAAALRILVDIYDARDRGLPLLGAIAWSVRQLARVQAALASGAPPEEAARRAGVPPFRARDLTAKAKAFRAKELERWLCTLAEADLALKSSRRPSDAILEDMLTRLCRRPA